jgi:hypothetical protein
VTPWNPGRAWKADAKFGFLGRKPGAAGQRSQPLHEGVYVDIEVAMRASAPAFAVWRASQAAPGAPLYSGGVLDCWPAWVVEALEVAQVEMGHIKTWLMTKEAGDG